jgi:hypothetical protein
VANLKVLSQHSHREIEENQNEAYASVIRGGTSRIRVKVSLLRRPVSGCMGSKPWPCSYFFYTFSQSPNDSFNLTNGDTQ